MKTFMVQDTYYEDPDDWTKVQAFDAEQAAEDYCDENNAHTDYRYTDRMRGADCILVKESEDAEPQAFRISVEARAIYSAEPIPVPTDD